jgi:hypothetical protein
MSNIINAQILPCGKEKINDAALTSAMQYEAAAATHKPEQVDFLIRVWFHVFNNSDGSNTAATAAQISSEFNSLLNSYAADNICFVQAGIDYTNSTSLNTQFNADTDPNGTALDPFQVPGCINIFYMRKINGNNNACNPPCGYGGIALGGIPGTFFLVATGNIGVGNSIGHEMGHCLGLLHTFSSGYGYETINGSNAITAGDRIVDTKADPFAYNGNYCYTTTSNGCTYTGNCNDPNGASNFSPPYNNLMSYWFAGNGVNCVANPVATTGQFTRIESFLNTNIPLIACSSPSGATLSATTQSSGFLIKSAINTFSTSGTILLNGSITSTLAGGNVVLSPGFDAAPNSNGLVVLKPKPFN